ncbi:MAG: carbon starvation protein A [Cytophagales bacterium]|nr:carbon starvation protein A [Cytophagales bacterium]
MNAALITIIAFVCLFLGYRFYARYIAVKIFRTESKEAEKEVMPSAALRDDVDYLPTNKFVLFGHHFSSIAGAAPILGPAIAIVWGWLPALLWVVVGAIFMGAVHDFGALVLSARNKGKSIGVITEEMIGKRSKFLFLVIIFLLVFIVLAVFAYAIAYLFVLYPGSVIPINFEIIVAVLIGRWVYKRKGNLLIPSLIALVLLYAMIYIGYLYPVRLPEYLWFGGSEVLTWIVFLMIYGFIASTLPVWVLLQPRDYINSHKLIIGLAVIYLAIFIAQPVIDAPVINFTENPNPQPWFPFLFITIACGAISGFHALVASGTSSKQLKNIKDARYVGYGAMMGEAGLAIAATIAVAAGFANAEAWQHHYIDNFEHAVSLKSKIEAFVLGTSSFLSELKMFQYLAGNNVQNLTAVFVSVLVISFAATSLDTATRIQRYIIGEIGEGLLRWKMGDGRCPPAKTEWRAGMMEKGNLCQRVLRLGQIFSKYIDRSLEFLAKNRYLQAFIAVLLSFLLVISDGGGKGGLNLWPLFGATNQMVGALTLLVLSVWLLRKKINASATLIPMVFITVVTFLGTMDNIFNYVDTQKWLLAGIASVIGICQVWIIGEAIVVLKREFKHITS